MDTDEFELSNEDLEKLDQEFLEAMNIKNIQHATDDSNDNQSLIVVIILLVLFLFGIVLASYWIVKGYRIRKQYIVNNKVII